MKRIQLFICMLSFVFIMPANASSAEIEGVTFADAVSAESVNLKLTGVALLKYMLFIKAYVGAFYLPETISPKDSLSDCPKRLELSYFHAIPAEDFYTATVKKIKDNVTQADYEGLKKRVNRLKSLYKDVKPGDRYSITYIPGKGTTLALNAKDIGTIPGADFAFAMFSIWIGKDPIDTSFRKRLLNE